MSAYSYALAEFMADERDTVEAVATFEDRLEFIWRMGRYRDVDAQTHEFARMLSAYPMPYMDRVSR